MAKTRGAAGAAMTETARERDQQPRHGDPLDDEVAEPATQPIVAEAGADPVGYVRQAIERPGVNDRSAATDDAIALRAYELYQARGGTHGADVDDWLQAEQELRAGSDPSEGPSDEPDNPAHRPID